MKYLFVLIVFMFVCFSAVAVESYTVGDTIKVPVTIDSGYYSAIDSLKYYIFADAADAVGGTYYATGDFTQDESVNSWGVDTTLTAEYIVTADMGNGIYYFAVNMVYDGTKQKIQMDEFRIGPVVSTSADASIYSYYIDQDLCDGSVEVGGVPLHNARVIVSRFGVNENFGETRTDASGNFTIYVPYYANGYLVQIKDDHYYFPTCGPVTPLEF